MYTVSFLCAVEMAHRRPADRGGPMIGGGRFSPSISRWVAYGRGRQRMNRSHHVCVFVVKGVGSDFGGVDSRSSIVP